jgi:hypothetical protein
VLVKKVKEKIESLGFNVSCADPGFFIVTEQVVIVFVLIYVDDMLIASESLEAIIRFKDLSQ